MIRRPALWTLGLVLLALDPQAAQAQTPTAAATEAAPALRPAMLSLGGKRIPLPPGQWVSLGEADYPAPAAAEQPGPAQPPVMLRSVVMGFLFDGRVLALVAARGNLAPASTGFGVAADCRRRDLHLARLETPAVSPIVACGFIAHVLHGVTDHADPAWSAALDRLKGQQATAPPVWLEVGFRLADADDLLDIRYLLDPQLLSLPHPSDLAETASAGMLAQGTGWAKDLLGIAPSPPPGSAAWRRSGWSPAATGGDPVRAWVVAQLSGWYDDIRGEIRQGFKGRGGDIAWPQPWQVAFGIAPPPVLPSASAAAPAVSAIETQALWKTISWRTVGSLLDATVSYLLTGSAAAAGAITIIGGMVNATAYYLHELVWSGIGAAGAPGQMLTELPEIGVAR